MPSQLTVHGELMLCTAALDVAQGLLGIICRRTKVNRGKIVAEMTPELAHAVMQYRECWNFDAEKAVQPEANPCKKSRRRKP